MNTKKDLHLLSVKESDLENEFLRKLLYDKRKIKLLKNEDIDSIFSSDDANYYWF